jgi:hypothetical protein
MKPTMTTSKQKLTDIPRGATDDTKRRPRRRKGRKRKHIDHNKKRKTAPTTTTQGANSRSRRTLLMKTELLPMTQVVIVSKGQSMPTKKRRIGA